MTVWSDGLPQPTMCEIDDDGGCTVQATECTCKWTCGEDEAAGCCYCAHSDIYEGCPRGGFWCDPDCGDPDDPCCDPEQRAFVAAARSATAVAS